MKPLILITCEHAFNTMFRTEQLVLNKTYIRAISAAGGNSVLASDPDEAEYYAELCDGLLLTGGCGVCPTRYGETFFDEDSLRDSSNMPRDEMEFNLVAAFAAKKKPMMGICRGHQLLNVYFGGKLIQNFPKQKHLEHRCGISHLVEAEDDSILGRLFGTEFVTNSYHQDAVTVTGEDVRITARSADGIVEATEHKSLPVFSVQWHPERQRGELKNPPQGPDMTPLLEHFIKLCSHE